MGGVRRRDTAAVILSVVSGSLDAIGFLALGGAFTSVMTGNMVLLGVGTASADGRLVGHAGAAIAAFVLGCVVGARIAGTARQDDPAWPTPITRALCVEGVVILIVAVVWWANASHPHGTLTLALLTANALALGVQSSAVQRFGVSGLSTTYMTGTLTTLVMALTTGRSVREAAHRLWLLLGLVVGAVVGATLTLHLPVTAPLVPLVGLVVVLAVSPHRVSPRTTGSREAVSDKDAQARSQEAPAS